MKQILLIILLLPAMAGFGQYQADISGTITEGPTGFPVPNQPVFFMIMIGNDSANIIVDDVITNDFGFYAYSFFMNGSFARVEIATPDCNGMMLSNTLYIDSSNTSVTQDFTICNLTICQAYFTYEQSGDYSFQFIDQSIGQDLIYAWDFGDGATSAEQHPSHTYNAMGIFDVCLFISSPDSTCADMFCTQVITGGGSGCMAQFTYYPDPLPTGYAIQFLDLSSGNIDAWSWSFGDGTSSQDQNPLHVFAVEGVYEVCLTVSGPDCESTWCGDVNVTLAGNCYNYFTCESSGTMVLFYGNHYPGIPSQFSWDFGDGTTGEGQAVSHTYAETGVYYVTLNTYDSASCSAASSQAVVVGDTIIFNQVYGQVFEGGFPMEQGYVMISSILNNPGFDPFMEVIPVDPSGVFVFPYVPNGQFVLYAVPEENNGYLPTYYGGAEHWAAATSFNSLESGMLFTINLSPVRSPVVPGNGSITGIISETPARDDLGLIQVLLYNEAFESIGFTSVQPDGSFSFYGLSAGIYYIYPELPGITSNLMLVEINELTWNSFVYLNFDGTSILDVEEPGIMEDTGMVFPNPALMRASLSINCNRPGRLQLTVADLSGRVCFSGSYQVNQGYSKLEIPVQNLLPGIYLLHITDATGHMQAVKFIKQ